MQRICSLIRLVGLVSGDGRLADSLHRQRRDRLVLPGCAQRHSPGQLERYAQVRGVALPGAGPPVQARCRRAAREPDLLIRIGQSACDVTSTQHNRLWSSVGLEGGQRLTNLISCGIFNIFARSPNADIYTNYMYKIH